MLDRKTLDETLYGFSVTENGQRVDPTIFGFDKEGNPIVVDSSKLRPDLDLLQQLADAMPETVIVPKDFDYRVLDFTTAVSSALPYLLDCAHKWEALNTQYETFREAQTEPPPTTMDDPRWTDWMPPYLRQAIISYNQMAGEKFVVHEGVERTYETNPACFEAPLFPLGLLKAPFAKGSPDV